MKAKDKLFISHYYDYVKYAACIESITATERQMVIQHFSVNLHLLYDDESPFYREVFPGYRTWIINLLFTNSEYLQMWEKDMKYMAKDYIRNTVDCSKVCFLSISFVEYIEKMFQGSDFFNVWYTYTGDYLQLTETGKLVSRVQIKALELLSRAFPNSIYSYKLEECTKYSKKGLWYQ